MPVAEEEQGAGLRDPGRLVDHPRAAAVLSLLVVGEIPGLHRIPGEARSASRRTPACAHAQEVDHEHVAGERPLDFTAPPDSGFTAVIEFPRDSAAVLCLGAMSAGIPAIAGAGIPARPEGVVAIQNGDVTVRYRRVNLGRTTKSP